MKIVLATRNRKKVEEIQRVVAGLPVTLLTLEAYPDCPEVEEDGETFAANAGKKAVAVARHAGEWALADDSGLVVDALGGEPGVWSARYAGVGASDRENLDKLLKQLGDTPEGERSARFVCVLALANADGQVRLYQGTVEGHIGREPRGDNGFGYDPVFVPQGEERTFAQMSGKEKDAMSHRGRALGEFAQALGVPGGPLPP